MGRKGSPEPPEYFFEYPRMVKFRVGLSIVHASATLFSRTYPHILNASIVPRPWYRPMRLLAAWLPCSLQRLLKIYLPGAFMPPRVVVKQLLKTDECATELFDNEIRAYGRLQHLQGTAIPRAIPRFFGEGTCEGKRALVLSLIDGPTAVQQQEPMSVEAFQQKVEITLAKFEAANMVYADVKLDRVILAENGELVIIDLEFVHEPEDRPERRFRNAVISFVDRYRQFLKNMETQRARLDGSSRAAYQKR